MVSYMETDYVMKFEVYDVQHDITKTHVIFAKEPNMKPHGCSNKNPSTIRAYAIIMNFLETIHDYFKTNKISCRMSDILNSLFNSAPGIPSSPTITLVNYDYNYHTNRYKNIKFILENKQVCYSEIFLILSISDNDIQPYDVKMDPSHRTIRDPHIIEPQQKIDDDVRKYLSDQEGKKVITKAKLKEIYSFGLYRSNAWDTFLNEKKIERLNEDDDRFKYFITLNDILDKIDTDDFSELIQQYTAENDSAAIQRGSILLNQFINDDNLKNGHVDISIYKVDSNFVNFTVIAMFTLSHDTSIEKWAICKFK